MQYDGAVSIRADGARGLAGDFSQVMRALASLSSDQEASRSIAAGDGDCRNNPAASANIAAFTIDDNRAFFQFREMDLN